VGVWLSLVAVVVMFVFSGFGYFNLPLLVIPTFITIFFAGGLFPIYVAEAMTLFPEIAASVNACVFALAWVMLGTFTLIGAALKVHSLLPLAGTFILATLLSIVTYYGFIARDEKQHKL